MLKKVNHIGIAVKDLDVAIEFYKKLGLEVEAIETVESQNVKVAFIPIGEIRIELLEATTEDSPIAKFIEKRGEGIHHIALEADEIKAVLKNAEHNNIQLIDRSPRKGAHNTEVAFLHPKSSYGVLLEICEDKRENI